MPQLLDCGVLFTVDIRDTIKRIDQAFKVHQAVLVLRYESVILRRSRRVLASIVQVSKD